ncbi:hypothetical protein [Haemophilus haemolyticus]|uniref:Uncharacterized protein n=1 Tax=Haemophilus haemolyticus TaxID=726 RepID=A0AAQ1YKV1_HAEHA|nr:hypothetical protein [Haemophilus haemolyticus]TDN41110.1 hypothetical protein EGH31_1326 [Haemophilus haemolyticus]
MSEQQIAKPVSTARNATIVGSLSALIPQAVKFISSLCEKPISQGNQEFIAAILIFFVPFAVYLFSLLTNRFIATPEEMAEKRKLKSDFKELKKALDDAKKNPHRYTEEQIDEFKKDFMETRKMLASIGRKALRATNP